MPAGRGRYKSQEVNMRQKNLCFTLSIWLVICLFQSGLSFGAETSPPKDSKDTSEFKALKYRSIGPAWGGRVSRAAGVPGDPNIFYFGAAASGVWKSVGRGESRHPASNRAHCPGPTGGGSLCAVGSS